MPDTLEQATDPAPGSSRRQARQASLFDPAILKAATGDSFRKLHPRLMVRNPVMFVVWVGSILTTVMWVRDPSLFAGLVAVWLWFTVLFANFAEAVAEGRGKAQADTLRKARSDTVAQRQRADGTLEPVPSSQLAVDDVVVVTA